MKRLDLYFNTPVDKVAKVVQQFSVVLSHQITPSECTVLGLRSIVQQVEPVDVSWNTGFHSIITKHTNTTTLGELSILIVEIFCTD